MTVFIEDGTWTNAEDQLLQAAILKYGTHNWDRLASMLPKKSAVQCKTRWHAHLAPITEAPASAASAASPREPGASLSQSIAQEAAPTKVDGSKGGHTAVAGPAPTTEASPLEPAPGAAPAAVASAAAAGGLVNADGDDEPAPATKAPGNAGKRRERD